MKKRYLKLGSYLLSDEERISINQFKEWLLKNQPDQNDSEAWSSVDPSIRWKCWSNWQKKVSEAGWIGVSWPKEYGGKDMSLITEFLIGEEMAKKKLLYAVNFISQAAISQGLLKFGTNEQKKKYLPSIARGDGIWCLAVSEPRTGSNVLGTATRAEIIDNGFVVNGVKKWSTHSPLASHCLVLVRSNDNPSPEWGLTMLIVKLDSPGVTITPLKQLQSESNFGQIEFNNVFVPKEEVLGSVHGGWIVQVSTWLSEAIPPWDISNRMELPPLLSLIKSKVSQNPKRSQIQAMAEVMTDAEMTRLLAARVLRNMEQSQSLKTLGPLIKLTWTEMAQKITETSLDWSSAQEKVKWSASPDKWLYKHVSARSHTLARAPSEIHRNYVARNLLGLIQ